jgi:hypothetical protein
MAVNRYRVAEFPTDEWATILPGLQLKVEPVATSASAFGCRPKILMRRQIGGHWPTCDDRIRSSALTLTSKRIAGAAHTQCALTSGVTGCHIPVLDRSATMTVSRLAAPPEITRQSADQAWSDGVCWSPARRVKLRRRREHSEHRRSRRRTSLLDPPNFQPEYYHRVDG